MTNITPILKVTKKNEGLTVLKKAARFIVKYRYIILAVIIALAGVCGYLIPKVNINTDMTAYLADSSEMKQGVDIMAEEFSDLSQPTALYLMVDDLTDAEKIRLKAELASVKNLSSVTYKPDDSDYNQGSRTLYVLTTQYAVGTQEEADLETSVRELMGERSFLLEQNNAAVKLTLQLALAAVGLLLVILFVMSGSWFEPILYLIVIGIAVVLNMGTNVFKSSVSDTTFSIAAILQLVLSMDYSIILTNRYKQELSKTSDKCEAMRSALANAFSSISGSAMTTFIGLLMLLFISFKIVPDLGIVLAKGVICSMLCVLTVLPALLIACTGAIQKTEKRMPKFPTKALAKFSVKLRVPLTVFFVLLFAGSCFLQSKTEISFSMSTKDGIKEYFAPDNTIIVLFDNKDSAHVQNIADEIMTDENVRSAVSYPTLIGKQSTAEELTNDISSLTDEFRMEPWMLKLLFYKYHAGENLPSVRVDALLDFIAEEIIPNDFFSTYLDDDMKASADELGKFTNKETLTKAMSVPELADFLGMDQDMLRQALVLYYAGTDNAPSYKLTIPAFVEFLQKDILSDPTYAAMMDADTGAQLDRLSAFTDKEIITTPMSSAEMAAFLDTPESSIRSAYVLYNGLFRAGEKISAVDFIRFMTTNETVSAQMDDDTKTQMRTLSQIMEKVVADEACNEEQFSEIFGMQASQARQLLLLYTSRYGDTSGWKLSPQTFVRFASRDLLGNPDYAGMIEEKDRSRLSAAEALIDAVVSEKAYTAKELVQLLSGFSDQMNETTMQLLLTYYGSLYDYDESYSMSIEQLFSFLTDDVAADPAFLNVLDKSTREQLSEMGSEMTTAVRSLKREKHSLLQITSKYPDESDETMRFLERLHALCDENFAEDYYVIGASQMYYEMAQGFRKEMLLMTVLTAVSIFLVVLLSFRNGLIPLILVMVVQSGVYISAAVCLLRGETTNYLAYLIVQCLLMGAAIDYGILFTDYYREHRKAEDRKQALASAYENSVHTILTSGLIMVGVTGLIGALTPDPTIGPILQTLSVGSLAAVLLILFVLPGILTACDKGIIRRRKKKLHDKERME